MKLQSDKKTMKQNTKQIRIDSWWHKYVRLEAANRGVSAKEIIEEALSWVYDIEHFKEIQKKL